MQIETLMIAFILIEMFQVFFILVQIYKTRQQMNLLFTDPNFSGKILENALHGFIEGLANDKEKQKNFFGFIQVCGQAMVAGATNQNGSAAKVKTGSKLLDGILNIPGMQGVFAQKVGAMLEKTGEKGVEKAVGAVTEGWG